MLLQVLPITTAIIALITALWGIYWGLMSYFKNQRNQNFRYYADAYNKIITPEIYTKWHSALNGDTELWAKLQPTMIAYLNLASEELYLHQSKLIDDKLWSIWKDLMAETIQTPFAQDIIDKFNYKYLQNEFPRKG